GCRTGRGRLLVAHCRGPRNGWSASGNAATRGTTAPNPTPHYVSSRWARRPARSGHDDQADHPLEAMVLADELERPGIGKGEGEGLARRDLAGFEAAIIGGNAVPVGAVVDPGHRGAGGDLERDWLEPVVDHRDRRSVSVGLLRRRRL